MTSTVPSPLTTARTPDSRTPDSRTPDSRTAPAAGAPRRWVRDFAEGRGDPGDLLGGKGAGLAEMKRIGLPVPPGFTVTTEACRHVLTTGAPPADLMDEVLDHLRTLERAAGRRFGDPADPLLVAVRSGAKRSMPGMMETVLDVGLTDSTVDGLGRRAGERFAWDCYRRLVQMYGRTVLDVPGELFEAVLLEHRTAAGVSDDSGLPVPALREVVALFRALLREHAGEDLPQEPEEQLRRAVLAVLDSWNSPRARTYRTQEGIPHDLGTAVNVVAMVFGNTGARSGSGVCFTRDPATGAPGAWGEYLADAQGEDVVSGGRDPSPCRPSPSCSLPRTPSCCATWTCSNGTTATCATPSSRSRTRSCGCCRPGSASARRPRPSGSLPTWPQRASSTPTRRCDASTATCSST